MTLSGVADSVRGGYLEGNIIVDAEQLVRNYDPTQTTITFNNNILPSVWTGPGGENSVGDPEFKHVPQLSETYFTNWAEAQILRDWLSLLPGSPAVGTGPNGRDKGGAIPLGASISGEPSGTTTQTQATLIVGVNRSGNGIPAAGWPEGSGYTHYRWRLDSGEWSTETPITTLISLISLSKGPHHVEVSAKRDSGLCQDDAVFGADALVSARFPGVVDYRCSSVDAHARFSAATPCALQIPHVHRKIQCFLLHCGAEPIPQGD